jgi:murein DD-endopeptidase MepM/ murein hydrolase activator NlpD
MTRRTARWSDFRSKDWRQDLRAFGAGAGCGFLGGALFVAGTLWHYGLIGPARAATSASAPRAIEAIRPGGLERESDSPAATMGRSGSSPAADSSLASSTIGPDRSSAAELKDRDLLIPVEGVTPDQLRRDFSDKRDKVRLHEALDILAPRNTPVKAVEDGTIARLFLSKAGGITVYQFDPSKTFCYYYAHLERYAEGLREGQAVRKGQVLGYIGTSGNAPKNTPHLHFAIFRLTDAKHWWEGTPLDPFDVLR